MVDCHISSLCFFFLCSTVAQLALPDISLLVCGHQSIYGLANQSYIMAANISLGSALDFLAVPAARNMLSPCCPCSPLSVLVVLCCWLHHSCVSTSTFLGVWKDRNFSKFRTPKKPSRKAKTFRGKTAAYPKQQGYLCSGLSCAEFETQFRDYHVSSKHI